MTGTMSSGRRQLSTKARRPYKNLPDRHVAKLFFVGADGGDYVCSGTLVNSTSKRMVSTAGHCVSGMAAGVPAWHSNVIVVPGYSSKCDGCGDAPFGKWRVRELTTTPEWFYDANFYLDVAFAVVKNRKGMKLVKRLGGQGIRFNQPKEQSYRSVGYPAADPFNGFNQRVCRSAWTKDDPGEPFPSGPVAMGITCDMTGGASGGGWLTEVVKGLGYVNSVNSFKYLEGDLADPNTMFGPYFGTEAEELYDFTEGLG